MINDYYRNSLTGLDRGYAPNSPDSTQTRTTIPYANAVLEDLIKLNLMPRKKKHC